MSLISEGHFNFYEGVFMAKAKKKTTAKKTKKKSVKKAAPKKATKKKAAPKKATKKAAPKSKAKKKAAPKKTAKKKSTPKKMTKAALAGGAAAAIIGSQTDDSLDDLSTEFDDEGEMDTMVGLDDEPTPEEDDNWEAEEESIGSANVTGNDDDDSDDLDKDDDDDFDDGEEGYF